jgi:hypothetical protein
MKNLFYTICLITGLSFIHINNSYAGEPETKKVCIEQKDAKTGKTKEVCKNVKIHKKLEGTAVPVKK